MDDNLCFAVRQKHDLTQERLAYLLKVHVLTISRWERGGVMSWQTTVLLTILLNQEPATIELLEKLIERNK